MQYIQKSFILYTMFFSLVMLGSEDGLQCIDLQTNEGKRVTFFAAHTEAFSLKQATLTIASDRKNITIGVLNDQRQGIDKIYENPETEIKFCLQNPLPKNVICKFVKFNKEQYNICKVLTDIVEVPLIQEELNKTIDNPKITTIVDENKRSYFFVGAGVLVFALVIATLWRYNFFIT